MFSRLRLGTQLWLVVSFLLATASAGLAWYLTQVQTRSLTTATQQRLTMREDSLTAKAALMARNAALASASAALTLDFEFLQGVLSKTVQGDETIRFGYIADSKDKVVVHSNPKLVGTTIAGSGKVPKNTKDGVAVSLVGNILEAVAPIAVGQDVWGTVHYGVSYEPVLREVEMANRQLAYTKRRNLTFSVGLALVLVFACVCISIGAASRLVRPLRALESGIQRVLARGASMRVEVPKLKELARVATGFNVLLQRLEEWEKRLRAQRLQRDLEAWSSEKQLPDANRKQLQDEWRSFLGSSVVAASDASPPSASGSLRGRLVGLMMGLTAVSVLVIGGLQYQRMRNDLDRSLSALSQQVRLDLTDKGFSITRNAALAVSQAASVREYLFLAQVVRATVVADTEIVTGFIKDPKGRVLVHSDPAKTGSIDAVGEHSDAIRLGRPESRLVENANERILEVTAPIQVGNSAWGTLSFGLSDEHQKKIFAGLQAEQEKRLREALVATAAGVGMLMFVAALVAWFATRRIVGPLDKLTRDLERICAGERTLRVDIHSCRELTTFSMSINELTAMTFEREKGLERQLKSASPQTQSQSA